MYTPVFLCLIAVSVLFAHLDVRPAGWLDRAVAYHKERFLQDLDRFAPVKITATVERAPPGYVDSNLWDYESVVHLLNLIRESEPAAPVRDVLRRALRPTRRFMSKQESFKHFPSLIKDSHVNFYYDFSSENETDSDTDFYTDSSAENRTAVKDDDIIVVSNPVEARLPSARISVRLLRSILEARALAARSMPSTKPSTVHWKTTKKSDDNEEDKKKSKEENDENDKNDDDKKDPDNPDP